jgi:hypothetical protein
VISTSQPLDQELMVTLQGAERWFLNSIRPVSHGFRNVPAVLSQFKDIAD